MHHHITARPPPRQRPQPASLRRRRRLTSLGLALLLFTSHADDWPRFLGPQGDGTTSETNLLSRFPPEGPQVLWHKAVGTGYSAPSVRGTHVVLHHRQGDEEIVECLDPASGASRWRQAYPGRFVDPYGYNNGPRSTPLLTTNRCLTFGAEGRLVCLDLESGRLIWERDTAKNWEIPEAFFGVGSSPALHGNRLIVMIGGQPNAGVVALDPATGHTLWESVGEQSWTGQPMLGWPGSRTVSWKFWDKQASYASPVVAEVHGRATAFCLTRQGLVALEPATGEVLCSRWFRAQAEESVNAANPVAVDDLVLISAAYYRIGSVLLRVRPDRRGFDEVWRSNVLEAHWSTPILHDGHVYAFSGRNEPDARFRCVELRTGELKWERDEAWRSRSTSQPRVFGRGACILADSKLITLGEGGLLGLFRPDPCGADELARWQCRPVDAAAQQEQEEPGILGMPDTPIQAGAHESTLTAIDLPPADDTQHRARCDEPLPDHVTDDRASIAPAQQVGPRVSAKMIAHKLGSSRQPRDEIHRQRQSVHLRIQRDDPALRHPGGAPFPASAGSQDAKKKDSEQEDVERDKEPVLVADPVKSHGLHLAWISTDHH